MLLDDLVKLGVVLSDLADLALQGVVALEEDLAKRELAVFEGSNHELQIFQELVDLRNPFALSSSLAWRFLKGLHFEALTRKSDCAMLAIEQAFSLALNGIVG